MQDLKIPEQAIRNKMRQEGMSDLAADNFFKGIYTSNSSQVPMIAAASVPDGERSFLDDIKKGSNLKHTEAPPAEKTAPRGGGLMADIKQGMKLKKIDAAPAQKKNSVVNSVMFGELMAAMEKNRNAIMHDDSDGSDSDSDNDFS